MEKAMDLLDTRKAGNNFTIYKDCLKQAFSRQISLRESEMLYARINEMYQSDDFDSRSAD
jgi:hypothetical protein